MVIIKNTPHTHSQKSPWEGVPSLWLPPRSGLPTQVCRSNPLQGCPVAWGTGVDSSPMLHFPRQLGPCLLSLTWLLLPEVSSGVAQHSPSKLPASGSLPGPHGAHTAASAHPDAWLWAFPTTALSLSTPSSSWASSLFLPMRGLLSSRL